MVSSVNTSVDDDTWYWTLLEMIIVLAIFFAIVEFNRLPKFIYINTTLMLIVFIVCGILIFIVESGHNWLFLFKYPLVPGSFLVLLLARTNTISKDVSIEPYLASSHGWLRWVAQKMFDRPCGPRFVAWFSYCILVPNILAAAADEYGVNDKYIYNIINGVILAATVPMPYIFGTKIIAAIGDTNYHDYVWHLPYGWFTLYSCWYLSFASSNYADALPLLSLSLITAYTRAVVGWRNDLWFQTRGVTLSIIVFWTYPDSFSFSRWFLNYAPWGIDVDEHDKLMDVVEWFALATTCYAVLWLIYCIYQMYKNIQSWRSVKRDEENEDYYDNDESDSVQVQLV